MKYEGIPVPFRVDLKNSIEMAVFAVLEAADFYFSDDFCMYDESIVEIVRYELIENYSYNKGWVGFARKSSTNEFRVVLKDVVEKMRQKQPSKAQIKFFLTMKYETGDEMVPSDDYLIFCRQLERLKSKSQTLGLATDSQVLAYEKAAKSKGIEIDSTLPWTKIQIRNGFKMLNQN